MICCSSPLKRRSPEVPEQREYCQKWALTVNGEKTKVMIFSKGNSVKANLTFGTNEIECVNNFHYLGFQISHDMKLKTVIDDRHSKATKMSKMVLRALRTSTNVSTKLLMSLFDKQIAPILLYGSSILGIPSSHNLIYLDNLPEVGNTRTTASKTGKTLHETCGCDIPFTSARRVGKAGSNGPRRILISLTNVQDKETVLSNSGKYIFSNYVDKTQSSVDKFHHSFCKQSLNVSKYASNTAILGELGRFPLSYNSWGLSIIYWLRLTNGTENIPLNEFFKDSHFGNHKWVRFTIYLQIMALKICGIIPPGIRSNFHNVFRQRLYDQFIQGWYTKINESTRLSFLSDVITIYKRSQYIDMIKNPEIRLTFTRLRIDMNIYSSYNVKKSTGTATCPLCYNGEDSLTHLLFYCSTSSGERRTFEYTMLQNSKSWNQINDRDKLATLLNMRCPDSVVATCCKSIHNLYESRVTQSY